MAHACRAAERESYDELEDLYEFQETGEVLGWPGRRTIRSAGCLWRADTLTRVHSTQSLSMESRHRGIGFFDAKFLVELLRRINESIKTSPDFLLSLEEYKTHELVSLVGSLSEVLVESDLEQPDEAVSEHELVATHRLIDWRKINHSQWQTGIRATLGEDGEALAVWRGDPRAEHIIEDEYEQLLPD